MIISHETSVLTSLTSAWYPHIMEKAGSYNYDRRTFEAICDRMGYAKMHAGPLMRAFYQQMGWQSLHAADVPEGLLTYVLARKPELPTIRRTIRSRYDDSVKFLLELRDGAEIEAVLMPERGRFTVCLSSQVGCAQRCSFCHTGRMGLKRQLSCIEIVSQVALVSRWLKEHRETFAPPYQNSPISNLVFMGMGEPLDNPDAVIPSLSIFFDSFGFALAKRKVSVSTAGHLPGLKLLLAAEPRVSLALSLHSPFQNERARIMPISRRYPLEQVLAYLREHYEKHPGLVLLVQYTVIAGVNDSTAHGEAIARLLYGLPAKVNLIPLNEIAPSRLTGPDQTSLGRFRDVLAYRSVRTMIRYSKGQDIGAACGQLVRASS